MSLTGICSPGIGEKKIFMNSNQVESRNQTFLGSRGRNESKGICSNRREENFHELERRQVLGIKRFWAQEAEMSVTGICSPESARRKFFMNSKYIRSRK